VEYIFGLPGATEVLFTAAVEDTPQIKYILGLHETAVIGMAEGYARTSGKVGVVNLHTNTGLAAGLPLLANALQGGVPLVVTAGQQDTRLAGQEPHLRGELVRIAEPFTKWAAEIVNAAEIPLVMGRAFKEALHPPGGPVFISLPQNLLQEELDMEYQPRQQLFTNLQPDPAVIPLAVSLLVKGRNPVMIVEDGVTKNNALDEVVKLAEMTGARVYQPWMSDVNFPVRHPQYMGDIDVNKPGIRSLLASADPLIVIGAPLFARAIYRPEPLLEANSRIIQIDDNPWQIGKNYPVTAGIEGNIKASVVALTSALRASLTDDYGAAARGRRQTAAVETQQMSEAFQKRLKQEADNIPISPFRLMEEVRRAMKPGTRIVDDCWSYSAILRYALDFRDAKSYQRSRGGGSIGWGLPGAAGVKLASPDLPVVCISGDGSAFWSIQSLWTCAHYNIPVTFIICANGCYRQVRLMQGMLMGEKAQGRVLGTDLSSPQTDFCNLAGALNIPSIRVERPEALSPALTGAFNFAGPYLVEVRVDGGV
jgi:benzoylformate decarboxylase